MPATTAPRQGGPARRLEHRSLVDLVTDQLHRAILNGEVAPGSSVSIVELCQQLGVSHIPVREALRRLESEGLLSLRPGRSALVAPLTSEDLTGIYRLRRLIEGELAERAGRAMSPAALARAAEALAAYAGAGLEPATWARTHHAFHEALLSDVAGVADRRVLEVLWRSGDRYLHLLTGHLERHPQDVEAAVQDHRDLLDLAEAGETGEFARAWVAHLDRSEAALLAVLAQRPGTSEP